MPLQTKVTPPKLHVARSRARLKSGEEVQYAYLRYSVWDEKKGRQQPKQLASLGRTDQTDEGRLASLEGFLKEWLRKDSDLPFEALEERFKAAEPAFKILCSRDFGLRWIAEQAWEELGYKDALAELAVQTRHEFRVDVAVFAMVLVQLVAPQSKRGAARWQGVHLFFPEGEYLDVHKLYSAMDVLAEGYEHVERVLKDRLDAMGRPANQLAHDLTSVPFAVRYDDEERAAIEEERQASGKAKRGTTLNSPPLRMRGHSKNKRGDLPQVVLEAVVNEDGLVVHHATHAGNTSDSSVTPDTLDRLQELGYRDVVWAGDSGTNSVKNREALRAAEFELVLGEGVARTKVVREVLRQAGRYRQHPENPSLSFKCVIAEATDEGLGDTGPCRLYVVRRNKDEEQHTLRMIEKHLAKIEETLATGNERKREALLHHRSYKRYVRPDGRYKKGRRPAGKVVLDRDAIRRLRLQAGKSVIATDNCAADAVEIDRIYRSLYEVERIFRRLKSTIRVGPIRHRRADRIAAHVMIAVMANNLGRWLEIKTGQTLESLQVLFDNLRVQEVKVGSYTYWQCVELEPAQRKAIRAMGYTLPPDRFTVEVDPLHQMDDV
jgi:hypothetical protein